MLTAPLLALAGLLAADPARPAAVIETPDIVRVEVTGLRQLQKSAPPDYLVRPDGTVSLGDFGSLSVAGLTTEQAAAAVTRAVGVDLSKKAKKKLKVAVTIAANNSKFYYVVSDFAAGERVVRVPLNGSETVLDAVSALPELPAAATKGTVWIARRAPAGVESILPVDWRGITERGVTATNYQILPGDRLYLKALPRK